MADDDFGQRQTLTYWKYVGQPQEETAPELPWLLAWLIEILQAFLQGFAAFGEVLLWLLVGAGLSYLIIWFVHNRALLGKPAESPQQVSQLPLTLVGLDIRPETLPEDVVAQARRHFDRAETRLGLSLLYRGALSVLVHREHLEIPTSATEQECLSLASQLPQTAAYDYLQWLTRVWQEMAYAHRTPEPEVTADLCQAWGNLYGQ
jgi:hypothetical protein